jgi:hypothetical protein
MFLGRISECVSVFGGFNSDYLIFMILCYVVLSGVDNEEEA